MTIKILPAHEKRKIELQLEEQFGIKEISGEIIAWGSERLLLFTGETEKYELEKVIESAALEKIGVYFAKIINDELKLTIEGSQILNEQIKKNIFEIDENQTEEWMMGRELNISTGMKGFVVVKNKDNYLGCGKASEHKITNFIPKERRLKNKS